MRDWAAGTRLGQDAAGAADPDDVVAATRERYVTAYEKLAGEPFSAWLERGRVRHASSIRPKAGCSTLRARRSNGALPALGFDGVRNVHIGRLVELDIEDPGAAAERCASSSSPTRSVEDYEIHGAPGRGPGRPDERGR